MNHYYMDFDPYVISQHNKEMFEEVRWVRLEEALRHNKGDQGRRRGR